jgi:hypothetical protein
MFMPLAFVEAPVPVLPKRGILKCLYRCEQHIDQVVMEPVVLVRDEGHQMRYYGAKGKQSLLTLTGNSPSWANE